MQEIQLQYPVSADGQTLTALKVRRPKVKDRLAAAKTGGDPATQEVRLFANLCEVSPATIEELDMADYTRLQEALQGFLS